VLFSMISLAQEPPPYFKFAYSKIDSDKDSLLSRYEFTTFIFRDSVYAVNSPELDWEKEMLIWNLDDEFMSMYMYGHEVRLPQRGDIIMLGLKRKRVEESMKIFIRVTKNFRYKEEIRLNNLQFKEGTYFFDMCASKKKYKIPEGGTGQTEIAIRNVRKRSVSTAKLNELLKQHACLE
jgi:hypothetical protein